MLFLFNVHTFRAVRYSLSLFNFPWRFPYLLIFPMFPIQGSLFTVRCAVRHSLFAGPFAIRRAIRCCFSMSPDAFHSFAMSADAFHTMTYDPVWSRFSTNDRTSIKRHETGQNYSKCRLWALSANLLPYTHRQWGSRGAGMAFITHPWRKHSDRILSQSRINHVSPDQPPSFAIPPRTSTVNPDRTRLNVPI